MKRPRIHTFSENRNGRRSSKKKGKGRLEGNSDESAVYRGSGGIYSGVARDLRIYFCAVCSGIERSRRFRIFIFGQMESGKRGIRYCDHDRRQLLCNGGRAGDRGSDRIFDGNIYGAVLSASLVQGSQTHDEHSGGDPVHRVRVFRAPRDRSLHPR